VEFLCKLQAITLINLLRLLVENLLQHKRRWPVIQKEGYGIVWALKKFKHWIFLGQMTVVTDHCPLNYLTETAPKNAKLMRWLLAIQEYGNVNFKYKAGSLHSAPDCISRMVYRGD
jgi:hypothetical protein